MSINRHILLRWLIATQAVSLVALAILGARLSTSPNQTSSRYPFIAKRLFVANPNEIIVNFIDLRNSLRSYVAASPEKIGLYFEYLPTGVNINVGANEEFFRASLVKLPVVMRAYKFIEDGRLSFDDRLTIEEKQLDQDFGMLWKQGAGATLTVRELIEAILKDSDNTAFNVLYERVNVQLLSNAPDDDQSADDVYDYLDIPRAAEGITPMITPKNYTSILKSLFFSAYLPYQASNEILETLSGDHEYNWLQEGIPEEILVAHKNGVYDADPAEYHVYADCGIIYYPGRPYSLCVMINSSDQQKSVAHIKNIGTLVYTHIRSINK